MKLYKEFEPIVSVIIPAFNREKLLIRAMDSVIKQEYKNWELIIVDDGSTDSTFSVVKKYQETFQNIRYLRHSNRKLPISLNTGIQISGGKYITFLGSDDEYLHDHILKRVEFFNVNKELDFIHGGVKIIGNEFVPDKNDLSKKIHLSKCTIGGTFFGKKEVFIAAGGFRNIEYSEDSDFYERIKNDFVIKKVNWQTYIYHRDNEDSITNSINNQNL